MKWISLGRNRINIVCELHVLRMNKELWTDTFELKKEENWRVSLENSLPRDG